MEKSSLVLAYLGDSIYEIYIRLYLINKNIAKVDTLQKEAVKYVSAKGQADKLSCLLENNYLTEEETIIIKRARNNTQNRHPKNTDILTYKHATALEALIGYLYLNDKERLDEIMNLIVGDEHVCIW